MPTKKPPTTSVRRGRPPTLTMADPTPDTPANIARTCMQGPPKKDWNYLKPDSPAKKPAKD